MILKNLKGVKKSGLKKREGRFLRLLGEVQARRNEFDHAIANLKTGGRTAIHELLVGTEEIKGMVQNPSKVKDLKDQAI